MQWAGTAKSGCSTRGAGSPAGASLVRGNPKSGSCCSAPYKDLSAVAGAALPLTQGVRCTDPSTNALQYQDTYKGQSCCCRPVATLPCCRMAPGGRRVDAPVVRQLPPRSENNEVILIQRIRSIALNQRSYVEIDHPCHSNPAVEGEGQALARRAPFSWTVVSRRIRESVTMGLGPRKAHEKRGVAQALVCMSAPQLPPGDLSSLAQT